MGYAFALTDEDYSTINEAYDTATATKRQQHHVLQQMAQELEELHEIWDLQEHLRLPPEDQQKLLRTVLELRDEVVETVEDTTPELQRTKEFWRIWELWELPEELIEDLPAMEFLPDECLQQQLLHQMPQAPYKKLGYEYLGLYQDSTYNDSTYTEPTYWDPAYQDYTYQESACQESAQIQ